MIKVEISQVNGCCGQSVTILKSSKPVMKKDLTKLKEAGFSFIKSYYDAGMIYVEDKGLWATGSFGMNELKIKCKKKDLCQDSLKKLENAIKTLDQ